MPGSKSAYLSNQVLNTVLGGPNFPTPTYVYVALSSALFNNDAVGTSFAELQENGYARVAVANNNTSWPVASNQQKVNGITITFPAATANWLEVLSFYILDSLAVGTGNILYGGDLVVPRMIEAGDTASFGAGSIIVTED